MKLYAVLEPAQRRWVAMTGALPYSLLYGRQVETVRELLKNWYADPKHLDRTVFVWRANISDAAPARVEYQLEYGLKEELGRLFPQYGANPKPHNLTSDVRFPQRPAPNTSEGVTVARSGRGRISAWSEGVKIKELLRAISSLLPLPVEAHTTAGNRPVFLHARDVAPAELTTALARTWGLGIRRETDRRVLYQTQGRRSYEALRQAQERKHEAAARRKVCRELPAAVEHQLYLLGEEVPVSPGLKAAWPKGFYSGQLLPPTDRWVIRLLHGAGKVAELRQQKPVQFTRDEIPLPQLNEFEQKVLLQLQESLDRDRKLSPNLILPRRNTPPEEIIERFAGLILQSVEAVHEVDYNVEKLFCSSGVVFTYRFLTPEGELKVIRGGSGGIRHYPYAP